ncbi:GNAT family N-acetyltransferase [Geodermatophilus marinus]|uniref:GNAT family N-acetyltransferase n=1 Tax=Geodermatophilus sp. LHW52908 TaxID=2303986 RepID=UPI001F45ECE7|nr:GNAT family N-acetyltransferase [Geodermatophilus sp. LHW52908]
MVHQSGLLDRIERYSAAAPLADARIETVGSLDVPVGSPAWPYPARPRPEATVTAADVRAAAELQERSGLPVAVEWVCECAPTAAAAVRAAGLTVEEAPLLVSVDPVELLLPTGVRLYVIGADDPQLARYQHLSAIAFAHPGPDGEADGALPGPPESARTAALRERIATGRTVLMVAVEHGEPVAIGAHHPLGVDGGEVSEIVGLATMPRFRGRGLGAGLASALVAHARETADLVFLVAGDDDVARVYERVGFARLATVGLADRAPSGDPG